MYHSVGILWPSGVLFRTEEPPHWVHSAFDLPNLELGVDLTESAAGDETVMRVQNNAAPKSTRKLCFIYHLPNLLNHDDTTSTTFRNSAQASKRCARRVVVV